MKNKKECLGFWRNEVKEMKTEIDTYFQLEKEDVFPCVPFLELEDFVLSTPLLNRRKLLLFIKEYKQFDLSKKENDFEVNRLELNNQKWMPVSEHKAYKEKVKKAIEKAKYKWLSCNVGWDVVLKEELGLSSSAGEESEKGRLD